MTGGRQVFVNKVLSKAYDSQAEHFLRGDVGVDGDAASHEVMIVNGKVRMYFGPFPAFHRIPLNYICPSGRRYWSRISGFCAGMIALAAFAGLIRMALRYSQLSESLAKLAGKRLPGRIHARLPSSPASRKSFYLRRSDHLASHGPSLLFTLPVDLEQRRAQR